MSGKKHDPISYEKALDQIFSLQEFINLEEEFINLENSLGRILFRDVTALIDNPPSDVSSMDGYAINGINGISGQSLKVIDVATAGQPSYKKLKSGETIRIFTGAKIPKGTNSVIIQEKVKVVGKNKIELTNKNLALDSSNIRKKGSDFTKGSKIPSGKIITPRDILLFSAMGHEKITVKKMPVISIISIGNELVTPGKICNKNQIYASNAYGISALLQKFFCNSIISPIASDNLQSIKQILSASLQDSDIILTSGGASVGDYDLVKSAARELGIQMYFDKVNIRPGKPTFAGHINKTPLIGLPGNPVSSYICAQLFLIPLIMKIVGYKFEIPKISSACLEINLGPNGSRKHFMRGKLTYKNEKRLVSPKERQDSSLIKTLQDSNCLIMRPPNDKARFQNDLVEIITLQ